MLRMRVGQVVCLCFSLVLLGCPQKKAKPQTIEGSYRLDKETMVREAEERLAKLPERLKMRGQMAVYALRMMDLKMTLKPGGKAEFVVKREVPSKAGVRKGSMRKSGSWEQNGAQLEISRFDPKTKKMDTSLCTFRGERLICTSKDKKARLIFLRDS